MQYNERATERKRAAHRRVPSLVVSHYIIRPLAICSTIEAAFSAAMIYGFTVMLFLPAGMSANPTATTVIPNMIWLADFLVQGIDMSTKQTANEQGVRTRPQYCVQLSRKSKENGDVTDSMTMQQHERKHH